MLIRWMSVHAGGQTVRFKYLSKEDFQRIYGSELARKSELIEQWKAVGSDPSSPNYRKVERELGKVEHLERYNNRHLKDLEDRNSLIVLYKCFLRAREAAEKGAQFFQNLNPKSLPGAKGKFSVIRGMNQATLLAAYVLSEYFGCADRQEHFDHIRDTFRKTALGLASKSLTFSDCAGRERVGPHLAEGIVPLRADSQNELEEEAQGLDDLYEKRQGKLLKMLGKESSHEAESQFKFQKWIDQQYLMKKYLESGDTKSIHIEYSYINKYSIDAMARIFLHEATHKFAATADFGYASQDTIKLLRPNEAIRNADSYAYAGMCILKNAQITPRDLEAEQPPAINQTGMDSLLQMRVVFGKGRKA